MSPLLAGSGNSGSPGFSNRGFRIVCVFDNDPKKIGQKVGEFTISDAANMVKEIRAGGIKVAMLTTPASAAQDVADKLIEAGIRGILNYAPIHLVVPEGVRVQHIDPALHLQRMTYYI